VKFIINKTQVCYLVLVEGRVVLLGFAHNS